MTAPVRSSSPGKKRGRKSRKRSNAPKAQAVVEPPLLSPTKLTKKPREERSYKEFFPDMNLDEPLVVEVINSLIVSHGDGNGPILAISQGEQETSDQPNNDPNGESIRVDDRGMSTVEDKKTDLSNTDCMEIDSEQVSMHSEVSLSVPQTIPDPTTGDSIESENGHDNDSSISSRPWSEMESQSSRSLIRSRSVDLSDNSSSAPETASGLNNLSPSLSALSLETSNSVFSPKNSRTIKHLKDHKRSVSTPASVEHSSNKETQEYSKTPKMVFAKPLPKPVFTILEEDDHGPDNPGSLPQDISPPRGKDASFKRPEGHYVRYVEPKDEELSHCVEYDMDERDKAWLDMTNAKRIQEGIPEISVDFFEAVMDRLEKEWFDLTKDFQRSAAEKQQAALPEESVCSICDDGECENSNAIVFCDGCNLAVHQDCYGVPYIPEGQWLCRKCMVSPETPVNCIFCPNEGGAFKQTTTNQWAHLLCAMWIPETSIANPVYMEPIDSIEKIPKSRWKLVCYICKKKVGACIQCHKPNCCTAFHPTCARKAGLYLMMQTHHNKDEITMKAYCDKHTPAGHRDQVKDIEQVQAELATRRPQGLGKGNFGKAMGKGGLDFQYDDSETEYKSKSKSQSKKSRGPGRPRKNYSSSDSKAEKSARAHSSSYSASIPVAPLYILNKVMTVGKQGIRKKREFVALVCKYWSLKREARRGAPLLKRLHLEPWTATSSINMQSEAERTQNYEALIQIRQDLEKVRLLAELVRKREQQKLKRYHILKDYWEVILFPYKSFMMDVLKTLKSSDRSKIFHEPVPLDLVPDYLSFIETPMDFSTVTTKLEQHEYNSLEDFEADLNLIWDNCMKYNLPDTLYYRAALRLKGQSENLMSEVREKITSLPLNTEKNVLDIPPEHEIWSIQPASEAEGNLTPENRERTLPSLHLTVSDEKPKPGRKKKSSGGFKPIRKSDRKRTEGNEQSPVINGSTPIDESQPVEPPAAEAKSKLLSFEEAASSLHLKENGARSRSHRRGTSTPLDVASPALQKSPKKAKQQPSRNEDEKAPTEASQKRNSRKTTVSVKPTSKPTVSPSPSRVKRRLQSEEPEPQPKRPKLKNSKQKSEPSSPVVPSPLTTSKQKSPKPKVVELQSRKSRKRGTPSGLGPDYVDPNAVDSEAESAVKIASPGKKVKGQGKLKETAKKETEEKEETKGKEGAKTVEYDMKEVAFLNELKPDYQFGQLCWAKIPGFPWFPAKIMNPTADDVPFNVLMLHKREEPSRRRPPNAKADNLIQFYDNKETWSWMTKDEIVLFGNDEVDVVKLKYKDKPQMKKEMLSAYRKACEEYNIDADRLLDKAGVGQKKPKQKGKPRKLKNSLSATSLARSSVESTPNLTTSSPLSAPPSDFESDTSFPPAPTNSGGISAPKTDIPKINAAEKETLNTINYDDDLEISSLSTFDEDYMDID
ncbi:hypothetical protein BKA69DRAFT_1056796 [Paraphysoderma sedebokerense]|nr:hypothetical protein BKA69DRAFT_1056796 [Paraphysoderma sedebokerense]